MAFDLTFFIHYLTYIKDYPLVPLQGVENNYLFARLAVGASRE